MKNAAIVATRMLIPRSSCSWVSSDARCRLRTLWNVEHDSCRCHSVVPVTGLESMLSNESVRRSHRPSAKAALASHSATAAPRSCVSSSSDTRQPFLLRALALVRLSRSARSDIRPITLTRADGILPRPHALRMHRVLPIADVSARATLLHFNRFAANDAGLPSACTFGVDADLNSGKPAGGDRRSRLLVHFPSSVQRDVALHIVIPTRRCARPVPDGSGCPLRTFVRCVTWIGS